MIEKNDSYIVLVAVLILVSSMLFGFFLGREYEQRTKTFNLKINRDAIQLNSKHN